MNLRISNRKLRFRITDDELNKLINGSILEIEVALPKELWSCKIKPDDCVIPLLLEQNSSGLALSVNRSELANLSSREGIEYVQNINGKNLLLLLEVDFRKTT